MVFDVIRDRNDDLPGVDFTFLCRPDGQEIDGSVGGPSASASSWGTILQVVGADAVVAAGPGGGGTADEPMDMPYGRAAEVSDPFGAKFMAGSPLLGVEGRCSRRVIRPPLMCARWRGG
ncbi:hypothetical protein [Rhodococcus rhodochrous]|uniref:Uncharacterized protein n=1 Tax=Rhodococcus rhodochrous TaxID=1829 RepID=A0AA47AGT5_RHORH|nr:hypothetical protein [Rhodococcus rhodochrous]UZF48398.1 hypothetical protein KUM34_027385 [Rhodococcus rhodochrous]